MKTKFIYIVLTALFVFGVSNLYSQYLISAGGTINTCSGTIYDSGGAGGNYGSNENYTITICSNNPGATMTLEFTEFNLESPTFDNLSIYDGPTAGSPQIILNAGNSTLDGQTIEASGECMTLVWETDGSVTYSGFAANISCGFPCQDFTIDLAGSTPPLSAPTDSLWIDACQGTDITFNAVGNYPNSGPGSEYTQSDATTSWHWMIISEDGQDDIEGVGLNNMTYTFDNPGGYHINLIATDINGCSMPITDTWRVRVSLSPTFTGTDGVGGCPGTEMDLSGLFQIEPWVLQIPEIAFIEVCFEDVVGVDQEQCFTHNAFAPGQFINAASDVESICMNMEHSYTGDLDIWIECPNGQTAMLFEQACGGTYFGEPDQNDDCNPGVGYQYCWSMAAPSLMSANCNSGSSMPAGDYLPVGDFSSLVGCPLNGEWCIHFLDNLGIDDGNVFTVELHFADYLIPGGANLWTFTTEVDLADAIWSGENVETNVNGNAVVTPTTSGDLDYTFSVTDDFGCTYDTIIQITVLPADDPSCCAMPTANAGPDDHVCTNTYTFGASLATGNTGSWAVVSGPGNVNWTNPNSPNAIATVDAWGVYEFEWTEQNQTPTCTDSDQVIVEFYPVPTTTFTFDQIMCNGDHTIITYVGNVDATATYTWNFDGATIHSGSGQGPYEISWDTPDLHSIELQVTANGCDSPDTLVNITNPELLTHTILIEDDPCFGSCEGRAELTVIGGTLPYIYSWGSPTNILPNLCAGNYTVTVEDGNGCITIEDFVINEPPELVINSTSTTNLTCFESNDGEIVVNASGGTGNLSYLWSDVGMSTSIRQNLPAGNYVVSVVDENGCEVVEFFVLTQPDELLVTISPNVAICEGTATAVQAQAMGGTTPYTYFWDQGEGYNVAGPTLNVNLDTTTTFNVYVEDINGCISNTETMIATVSPEMVVDSIILEHNRCYNSCDGSAEIVMHGGMAPFQYSWGSATNTYEGLCADIYTVTVTDIIGCQVSEMFIITQPTQMTYTTDTDPASCFGYDDGEAAIFVQGGVPPYSYVWPNGHDTETMINEAGNYEVTVLDDHLCRITADFTITQPDEIYVLPIGNRTICQGQTTMLTTQATGGTPYYDFHWTGNDGSVYHSNQYEVSPTQTTIYTLVVTDSHGCSSTPRVATVTVNPDLEILSVLTSNDTVCPGDPAIIYVDVEGGNGGPYMMTLQDGRVVPSPFTVYPDTTTMFYITLEDMCGTPSVVDSILINVRPKPGNLFTAEDVEGCPPFAAYFNEGTPNDGQTYLWQFGDNGFSTDKNPVYIYQEPGIYTVSLEVMDDFGCKNTRTVENMITVYQGPKALFEINPEVLSMLNPEAEFINHSVDADSYYWFFGDGDSSLFVNPRHQYPSIGEYEVILVAATERNCKDTTSRMLVVQNEFAFYVPTSFTPNGDGMNDCFRPCGNGIDKNTYKMVVYDRWGNLVYDTERFDPDAYCDACSEGAWDGTDNGSRIKGDEILPNGLYHWYCEFHDWNGTLYQEQGTVTLIR
ncbi:MAG: gliding motility-associated C-terminal domain-containing protein [Bacteroidales bacterium]|nr:gliding motility-associated C-terminal domain-containing protein [Bacteroidales bacterium]